MKYFLTLILALGVLYSCTEKEEVNQTYINKLISDGVFFDSVITYKIKGDTFFLHFPKPTKYTKWSFELVTNGENFYTDTTKRMETPSKEVLKKQRFSDEIYEVNFKNQMDGYLIFDKSYIGEIKSFEIFCRPQYNIPINKNILFDGVKMRFKYKKNSDTLNRVFMKNDNGRYLVINYLMLDSLHKENKATRKFVIDSLQSFGSIFSNLKDFEKNLKKYNEEQE